MGPATRRGVRACSIFAAIVTALGASMITASPSVAGSTAVCAWSGGIMTVTLIANGDNAVFLRSGANIMVNGATCSGATVTNTDTIAVTVDNPTDFEANRVIISHMGGRFAPGANPEGGPATQPEIEFTIDTGDGLDEVRVIGGTGPDRFAVGNNGGAYAINLNTTETSPDIDVLLGTDLIRIVGGDGNDSLRGTGGAGTGGIYPTFLTLLGGNGNDVLRGGNGRNIVNGGPGDDKLYGGALDDRITGGTGVDQLFGGGLDDTMKGNAGPDKLYGGLGPDDLTGGPGADDLYGQAGKDTIHAQDGVSDLVNAGPPATGDYCELDFIDNLITC